jgi:ATP adenylyltransferase
VDRLWSPWRMEYLEAAREESEDEGCPFCAILGGEEERERVLAKTDLAFVTLAKYPYNPGHLLILPVRHVADFVEVTGEENADISVLLQRSLRALRAVAEPGGFNVGLNLGRAAGAGIPEHLHWHVVPRWGGDTNFMPVIGKTRVLPELLGETFAKLRPAFDEGDAVPPAR